MARPKTAFEWGLIFVLLVNVLFMASMVFGYILYSFFWNSSGSCARLCCKLRNLTYTGFQQNPFGNLNVSRSHIDRIAADKVYRRSIGANNFIEFPHLGAVLENLYFHESAIDEKILRCSCVIVSNSTCLISKDCIRNLRSPRDLSIRLNSNYWSVGGDLRKVLDIKIPTYNNLALLRFDSLNKPNISSPFNFNNASIDSYSDLHTFTWFSNLYKFRELEKKRVKLLNSGDCPDFPTGMKGELFCGVVESEQLDDLMAPLMLADGKLLIGVHSKSVFDHNKKRTFLFYSKMYRYDDWMPIYNEVY